MAEQNQCTCSKDKCARQLFIPLLLPKIRLFILSNITDKLKCTFIIFQSSIKFFSYSQTIFVTFLSSNLNSFCFKCWCIYTELKCSNSQILFVMPLPCFGQVGITWILPVIHLLNIVCLRSILFESDNWHESV